MLVDIGYRVLLAQAIKTALDSGATFQVGSGAVPATAVATPAGTILADGPVVAASVSLNTSTGVLTIGGLSDTVINATGTPTWARIIDNSFAAQFTAKMAVDNTANIEVTITDQTDAAATQLLANRAFSGSIAIQF